MREIKFRAWDGTAMYIPIIYIGKVYRSDRDYEDGDYAPHDDVMQYTGLKDRNGKEIYEGDIIKSTRGYTASVEWVDDGRFLGFTVDRSIVYVGQEPAVEVIGNIYENPELLGRQAAETNE